MDGAIVTLLIIVFTITLITVIRDTDKDYNNQILNKTKSGKSRYR